MKEVVRVVEEIVKDNRRDSVQFGSVKGRVEGVSDS